MSHGSDGVYSNVLPRHLYVHVPFCARRCAYCDFAIAVRRVVPVEEFVTGLRKELDSLAPPASELDTIYLGGGTPSRLGAAGLAAVLDAIRQRFKVAPNAEVTIEANPEDVMMSDPGSWLESGINRVSLGIQSFDDRVLAWMHRTHSAADARTAFDRIRSSGVANVSLDLIFALPAHLERSWEKDLESALSLDPDHISLYGLTVEAGTPLSHWKERGTAVSADDEVYADEFLMADRMMTAQGYMHYEVSNFARPGMESRHNSSYWSGAPYLGIGPSAHSFDGETRRWNVRQYAEWVSRLKSGRRVVESEERLDASNRHAERVYLGLRTASGLAAVQAELDRVRDWSNAGWAMIEGNVVRLTPEGWLRLDALASGLT